MLVVSILFSISAAVFEFFTKERLVIIIPYGFIIPVLLVLPRFFYRFNAELKTKVTKDWLKNIERLTFLILILNIPGSLWLHKMGFQYDRFLHFFAAFFSLMILFLFFLPYRPETRAKNGQRALIAISSLVLCAFIFLWEDLQHFIDITFGTRLFFDVNQIEIIDYIEDVGFGVTGMIAGIFYLRYSFKKFLLILK